MQHTGQVKWWNDKKGWGFIVNSAGQDVFVHHSQILGEGWKSLEDEEIVSFKLEERPNGKLRALEVNKGGWK